MSFPRYPEYKDSGVEWLEEVPAHWDARRLKFLFTLQKRAPREDDGIVTAFRDGEVTLRSNRRTEGFTNAIHEIGYQGVRRGDLVIHAMDAFAGAIGVSDSDGKSTPVYSVCIPANRNINAWYYGQLLRNMALSGYVNSLAKGVRERSTEFRWADASEVILPVPDVIEQQAIATFLDRETTKINALVAEQEKLIALLQEKRQAVISHAVTKGLDPNVPMKDSGVEWLGEVPAHWEFGAIKHFLMPRGDAIKTGPFGSHLTAAEMLAGPIKVYNQRNVIDCDFVSGDNFITEEKFAELRSFETYPGDLLITTRGTIGRAAILPDGAERGILHPCLLRIQPDNQRLRTAFLSTLIQDSDLLRTQLSYQSNATTIEVIYSYTIASVVIPVPPIAEQDAIMRFLSDELTRFNALTAEARRAVDLLQERRTALISAAVTGQIDVRGLAGSANTPDLIAASAYAASA